MLVRSEEYAPQYQPPNPTFEFAAGSINNLNGMYSVLISILCLDGCWASTAFGVVPIAWPLTSSSDFVYSQHFVHSHKRHAIVERSIPRNHKGQSCVTALSFKSPSTKFFEHRPTSTFHALSGTHKAIILHVPFNDALFSALSNTQSLVYNTSWHSGPMPSRGTALSPRNVS